MFHRRFVVLAALTAFSFAVTYLSAMLVDDSVPTPPLLDSMLESPRIAPDAELVRRFIYVGRGEETVRGASLTGPVPPELAGLTLTELVRSNPHWQVVHFTPSQVVVEEFCMEQDGGFLRLEDGELLIYSGRPEGCHRLIERIAIDDEQLLPRHRIELARDIPFANGDDLAMILEGLAAP